MHKCTIGFKTAHRSIFIETGYAITSHRTLIKKKSIEKKDIINNVPEQHYDDKDKQDQDNYHVAKMDK